MNTQAKFFKISKVSMGQKWHYSVTILTVTDIKSNLKCWFFVSLKNVYMQICTNFLQASKKIMSPMLPYDFDLYLVSVEIIYNYRNNYERPCTSPLMQFGMMFEYIRLQNCWVNSCYRETNRCNLISISGSGFKPWSIKSLEGWDNV